MRVLFLLVCSLLGPLVAQAATPAPADVVVKLYRDFAWEAVLRSGEGGLAEQPEAVLQRYFTPHLAALLVRDAACTVRTREICRLDFGLLWGSQDPSATDMSIVADQVPGMVTVQYLVPPTRERMALHFRLVQTRAGWRVADIAYPAGPSLAALLARPME